MDPEFAKLLNNTLPGGLSVFAGSLPLLGVIAWLAFQQGGRFRRIEQSIDKLDATVSKLAETVSALVVEVRVVNTRVTVLEDREKQPRIINR